MNLPNRLTILRVLLIPVFIFSLFLPSLFGASQDLTAWLSSCIFIIAGITDTLDGKIAAKTGDSKWITSSDARKEVYKMRKEFDCILTSSNTIIMHRFKTCIFNNMHER